MHISFYPAWEPEQQKKPGWEYTSIKLLWVNFFLFFEDEVGQWPWIIVTFFCAKKFTTIESILSTFQPLILAYPDYETQFATFP